MLEAKDQGCNAEVLSKEKGLHSKRSQNAGDLRKKRSLLKKSQGLWRAPRRNNIAHNLGAFSTTQNMVLSSSRELGIFEDLAGFKAKDFKLCSQGQRLSRGLQLC